MQYMLLIYGDETSLMDASPEDQATGAKAWVDYTQWLKDEGRHVAGDALHPTASATTLRFDADGKTLTTDGPFAETKEQLGGLPARARRPGPGHRGGLEDAAPRRVGGDPSGGAVRRRGNPRMP